MRYEGKIYRPWPEAESLLIQVTLGCSNNNCTFCTMFKDKTFKKRKIEEIYKDIEMARKFYRHVDSIFLVDGNVMVLKTEFLLKVVRKIKEVFPEVQNISLYSELNDLRRKTVEDLIELRQAGVTLLYAGLESGDPVVLENIKKRMSPKQALEGMKKAKAAGIDVLLSFIFGLGGRERSKEHIEATTSLLNELEPEQIAPMALAVQPESELEQEVLSGEFILPTPAQILQEEKYLLENLGDFETYYWGDHGNNIVPQKGMFQPLRKEFLTNINNEIVSNPIVHEDVHRTFAW
ncbi:Radical SAM superfamily protein [Candidatus Terasakiella magnetica]|uniref:Radical SAM superfamily protein n=1 Tax=Candidatus Terasakiella magnetica TaxID=1867952 RepID=A0A1C3RFE7_9PROT|nr:radical SAM protein [Candidatus Terasakiella magnetica]SCA55975.1 Radical SAM superfamily protein [Candidatus Terasakiella magnetica]